FAASDFSSGNIFAADSVPRLYSYFLNPGVFVRSSEATVAAPTITNLSPASLIVGSSGFPLTITGSNFEIGATVNFDGTDHILDVTFTDTDHLSVDISASEIATAGPKPVTVTTLTGGASSSTDFIVDNPVAGLTSLSQTSATKGDAAFTLTVTGTNFVSGAVVHFAGTALTTTFGSSTSLTADVTAAQLN